MTDEVSRTLDFLANAGPLANTTVSNKEADEIMLQTGGTMLTRGVLYNIICKRASPSVCLLTLKRAKL